MRVTSSARRGPSSLSLHSPGSTSFLPFPALVIVNWRWHNGHDLKNPSPLPEQAAHAPVDTVASSQPKVSVKSYAAAQLTELNMRSFRLTDPPTPAAAAVHLANLHRLAVQALSEHLGPLIAGWQLPTLSELEIDWRLDEDLITFANTTFADSLPLSSQAQKLIKLTCAYQVCRDPSVPHCLVLLAPASPRGATPRGDAALRITNGTVAVEPAPSPDHGGGMINAANQFAFSD
ncbi:hypothetical protein GGX14DRAFT_571264 [Mycena pura]|uniref:Uncharacterized protein n=1 Tax=Mycena pura TaxID=153505 RepID=A0AAD6Y4X1_9AGAR|nr:hypothetical protein GGX14DRAFT_571264 [Mycena pura]